MTPANPDALADALAENDRLRAALANSGGPCAYCNLSREDWTKCRSGFPGCGRADDAMPCPHFGAEIEANDRADAALADLQRVTAERDDLKIAAGFKPGDFRDDLSRDVIINDIAGMRPAMVEARRAAARAQVDADLWTMRMLEEWPGDTLLLRLWRQRQEATKAKAAAEARAAQLQAEVEAAAYLIDRLQACHDGRTVRDLPEAISAYLAARAATAREGQTHTPPVVRSISRRQTVMAENRPCTICGETDPYPASFCLAKLSGCAEPGKPCQYSVEGQARLQRALDAQAERWRGKFEDAAAHGAKIREASHGE